MVNETKPDSTPFPKKLRFFYIKGNAFRVLHVDGIIGGITPKGLLHIAAFSERPAIPQSVEHEVSVEGRLSDPVSQEGKTGVVRELDVDMVMTRETATDLRDWLSDRIAEFEKIDAQRAPNQRTRKPPGG